MRRPPSNVLLAQFNWEAGSLIAMHLKKTSKQRKHSLTDQIGQEMEFRPLTDTNRNVGERNHHTWRLRLFTISCHCFSARSLSSISLFSFSAATCTIKIIPGTTVTTTVHSIGHRAPRGRRNTV